MIEIRSGANRNLKSLCDKHFESIKNDLNKRLRSLPLSHRQKEYFTEENLKEIITADPKALMQVNRKYSKYCKAPGNHQMPDPNVNLAELFKYSMFTSKKKLYNAYTLTKDLGVHTCPYCNRNYIVTVENDSKSIIRPELDHFFPQSTFPLLGLSFYNLIPSCHTCNTLKMNKDDIGINPYECGFDDSLRFNFLPKNVGDMQGNASGLYIKFLTNNLNSKKVKKCLKNVKLFHLEKIYEISHSSEINEIIKKYVISNGKYLDMLSRTFEGLGSFDELYKIAFGNFRNKLDFENRPLAKMTYDIVAQLEFSYPNKNLL